MRVILIILFSSIATGVIAQWNPNGATTGPIYYTGGSVGIGTSTPTKKLDILTDTSLDGIQLQHNNSRWIRIISPNMAVDSYNGITKSNDAGIIYGYGAVNTTDYGFVIAPNRDDISGLRINSTGLVGIGVESPASKLEVNGTISMVRGNRLQFLEAVGGSPRAFIESDASNNLKFHIGSGVGADAMNLDGAGNLGLGILSPTERLHVNGLIRIPVATANDDDSPGITSTSNDDFLFDGEYINQYGFGFHNHNLESYNGVNSYVSGHFGIDMFTLGQHRLRINRNGNVGVGTTTPSARFHVVGSGASISQHPSTATITSSASGLTDAFAGLAMSNEPAYGASLIGARARDNSGSLSAVQSGDVLTGIYGRGYTGDGWTANIGAFRVVAAENFSTTTQGTQIDFATTPIGASSRSVRMTISPEGYVGIGTASPTALLHLPDIFSPGGKNLLVGNDGYFTDIDVTNTLGLYGNANTDRAGMRLGSAGPTLFGLNGNLGIGTTNPTQRLEVNGTVYSREVKVDLAAGTGPDYVFEPTYNLPTLAETEAYIKANKHLPEVPSAKEMEANGINLSEMNMLLLKKVEELTLHLIEQNKTNADMQLKLAAQQKEIELLKSKIK